MDAQLVKDTEFVLGQVTNGMSFVFVEFLGLLLFNSFEKGLSSVGKMILKNGSMSILSQNLNYDEVCKSVADQKFKENDLLAVSWWVFRHVLEEMVGGSWIESYHLARNRTRFNHSRETRERLYKGLLELHRFTERTQLTRVWATGIKPPNGLFGFVRDTLLQSGHPSERANIHRAGKTLYA